PLLRSTIKQLEEGPEDQIPNQANTVLHWTFPRGDLFHWVAVLDRFDSILSRVCKEYDIEGKIQSRDFDAPTKKLVLAITNLSRVLFENCTNRNIYNSYDEMCNLLNTFDLDVTEAVLRFILRPAQRVNNPRAIRSNFNPPHEHISFMVPAWGSCKNIVQCCRDDMEITDDMTVVKMKFYRFSDDQNKAPVENNGTEEGVQLVKLDVDDKLTLANGIRIAKYITNPTSRRQLVVIRLLALAIMGHTVSETGAHTRVFQYDPQLITSIVELLQPEKAMPVEVQTCALYALEALARYRGKLPEMLAAVNASANHGVLMQMLRKINTPEIEHGKGTY
ncbi:hypothetical protein PHYBLDRAFT_108846, partial [Phycomyces blakesleeanus NRRL 1555(-)]